MIEKVRKLPLGCSPIHWTCDLCCSRFRNEKDWKEHISSFHTLEDVTRYETEILYLLPYLKEDMDIYRKIISEGDKKK